MPTTSEAHILVTLPNAKLTSSPSGTLAGRLALEYVTFDIPRSAGATTTAIRDVMLILRLGDGTFEEPLDPARTLTTSVLPSGARRYVFHATRDDPEFALEIPLTPETADDVELFHSVLAGYATDFRGGDVAVAAHRGALPAPRAYQNASGSEGVVPKEDLRGRFAFMNEESGEIVGALDGSVRVHEDASLGEKGHEADPVVVELPEGADTLDDVEVLVRTVPPEDRDWMVRGAVFARHVSPSCAKPRSDSLTHSRDPQPCHLRHSHSTRECDDLRIKLLHLAFDAIAPRHRRHSSIHVHVKPQLQLQPQPRLRLQYSTTIAHASSPAIPNDPEAPHSRPRRQRRRRKAEQQSRRGR